MNVLAREYCDDIKRKNKPIILSHRKSQNLNLFCFYCYLINMVIAPCFCYADMLPGLLQGQEKMSKSDSSSAVFMEDEEV